MFSLILPSSRDCSVSECLELVEWTTNTDTCSILTCAVCRAVPSFRRMIQCMSVEPVQCKQEVANAGCLECTDLCAEVCCKWGGSLSLSEALSTTEKRFRILSRWYVWFASLTLKEVFDLFPEIRHNAKFRFRSWNPSEAFSSVHWNIWFDFRGLPRWGKLLSCMKSRSGFLFASLKYLLCFQRSAAIGKIAFMVEILLRPLLLSLPWSICFVFRGLPWLARSPLWLRAWCSTSKQRMSCMRSFVRKTFSTMSYELWRSDRDLWFVRDDHAISVCVTQSWQQCEERRFQRCGTSFEGVIETGGERNDHAISVCVNHDSTATKLRRFRRFLMFYIMQSRMGRNVSLGDRQN